MHLRTFAKRSLLQVHEVGPQVRGGAGSRESQPHHLTGGQQGRQATV